ncbi:uncharacterized protein FA14DRAFT_182654 [Meira miltonrushii]|uniref:Uncharacterized protein n=1 Tax=Meira miltonrushii TaxID=1280837 RepID=A0A316V5D4_9BASI|nr:uncharacterized protein FA14DRAFT_182654 [Meira miltonrushii]PWN31433.1 hypothetical protein FA14DRAFT_182654 [Meira miltonrushii]
MGPKSTKCFPINSRKSSKDQGEQSNTSLFPLPMHARSKFERIYGTNQTSAGMVHLPLPLLKSSDTVTAASCLLNGSKIHFTNNFHDPPVTQDPHAVQSASQVSHKTMIVALKYNQTWHHFTSQKSLTSANASMQP